MKETEFVNELMRHILEGIKIPKVQVERAIGPILGFFIERVLDKYFEDHPVYSGTFQIISPEFPLKKENNQSTNIDFLLVNTSRKILVLFELKTDLGSIDSEQLGIYLKYKELVSKLSANEIRNDLIQIKKASKGTKYETIISCFNKAIPNPNEIRNAIIVYLTPNAYSTSGNNHQPDFVMSFSELPELINHKYAEYWQIIRNNLLQLDKTNVKTQQNQQSGNNAIVSIISKIKQFSQTTGLKPEYFQIGIKGDGKTPNYQVIFSNGQIKTFTFYGKPHHFPIFKKENLSNQIRWEENW